MKFRREWPGANRITGHRSAALFPPPGTLLKLKNGVELVEFCSGGNDYAVGAPCKQHQSIAQQGRGMSFTS